VHVTKVKGPSQICGSRGYCRGMRSRCKLHLVMGEVGRCNRFALQYAIITSLTLCFRIRIIGTALQGKGPVRSDAEGLELD
jgi:hypothetical protein